jgi:tRNA 5-methylaminomethyl-2-thiouridine biosynthesis bifunctional protein
MLPAADETSPLIDWHDGQPVSRRFGDVYFSRDSGLEETRHVFLAGNRLRERWAALAPHGRFTLGETGFGTGLNFAAAWALWNEVAPPSARLRYVSVERHPLASADISRTLGQPRARRYRETLAQGPRSPGWHRFARGGRSHAVRRRRTAPRDWTGA